MPIIKVLPFLLHTNLWKVHYCSKYFFSYLLL